MLKFILLVLSVFISLVAAAHTVSFLSHGQYLEAIITFFYLFCGTFLAAALIKRLLILRRRAVILVSNQTLPIKGLIPMVKLSDFRRRALLRLSITP